MLSPVSALGIVRQEATTEPMAPAPAWIEPGPGPGAQPSLQERARMLEDQAGALYGLGQYVEALQVQRRSVESHRQLVAQDPSQRLKLAASLHNLGVVLIRLGRKEEAIPPTAEALALYRSDPSSQAGGTAAALERPLRNLVLLYFESNRPEEALPLADLLVRLHPTAPGNDPLLGAQRMDVLNLRASLLVALERPKEARQDLETAVALGRQLAGEVPENLTLRHGLAGSLLNLSQVADLLGQWDQATAPAQEAEAILGVLARLHPELKGDWAKALSRLGHAHAKTGDALQARRRLEESILLMRSLNPAVPSGSLAVEIGGYQDDLAHALNTLAMVNHQLQRPREARAAGVEAMELYALLAREDPRYKPEVERLRSWLSTWPEATPATR
ncbi:MAG: tetratricopeptide repeat protein [Cyanobacteriota bacterium]